MFSPAVATALPWLSTVLTATIWMSLAESVPRLVTPALAEVSAARFVACTTPVAPMVTWPVPCSRSSALRTAPSLSIQLPEARFTSVARGKLVLEVWPMVPLLDSDPPATTAITGA